jgi:hypothetical protein
LTAKPSHVRIDVDGLACPLHRPTACSRQTRGYGLLSDAVLSCQAIVGGGNGIRPLGLSVGERFLYVVRLGCVVLGCAPAGCMGWPSCMVGPPSSCRAVGEAQAWPEAGFVPARPRKSRVGPKKAGFVPAYVTQSTWPGIATTMRE